MKKRSDSLDALLPQWSDLFFYALCSLNILLIYGASQFLLALVKSFLQGSGWGGEGVILLGNLLHRLGPLVLALGLGAVFLGWAIRFKTGPEREHHWQPVKILFIYDALLIGGVFVLFPFIWMVLTALKPKGEALSWNLIPSAATLSSFKQVWTQGNFALYFYNSLVISLLAGVLVTLLSSMGGYVFAKKEFRWKQPLFGLMMATMMIPGMMYMVPQFFIIFHLGWHDSFLAIIVPHLANVFGLLLMKQFMETIPNSLIEAAKLDGATERQIFQLVIFPLSMPVAVTLFLLTFLFHWSNFLWQLIVTVPESAVTTLPVGLALFRGQHGTDWTHLMSASCYSIIPITLLFLFAQRFFIEGMTQGAVKE